VLFSFGLVVVLVNTAAAQVPNDNIENRRVLRLEETINSTPPAALCSAAASMSA
jgi:hypothetical protein